MTTSEKTDWKAILDSSVEVLDMISPWIGIAVKAGTIAVTAAEDFEKSREEIAKLAAQTKVAKAQIDTLDDSIQARRKRIHAPE